MEIIRLEGYTEDEKVEIAERHLIAKQIEAHGLKEGEFTLTQPGLRDLIRFLSSVTTLMPGTLITTGTPAGVSKLADGDHLKGTISGIGTMELNVAAEQ